MFIIDRLEEKWAVVEYDHKIFNIPRCLLPAGAQEGAVIKIKITVDENATAMRRQKINEIAGELFTD